MAVRLSVLIVALAAVLRAQAQPAINGLDHINVAVANLDSAAERYRDLGFSLKPGTLHPNGIQNRHAKFPDGTELELITAPAAIDALTAMYRRHLENGDGPAFLAFFGPRSGTVAATLKELQLSYIFFGGRNHSPTDRPEHFAHANTAESLVGVWLAGADLSAERRLLQSSNASLVDGRVYAPEPVSATVARVPDGEVWLLSSTSQRLPGRKIVGVTVRVRSLDSARRILAQHLHQDVTVVRTGQGTSVFLPPHLTHGLWLELRQPT